MKDTIGIDAIVMMTGLSDRTIRNYIADGFLQGDKSSGSWQFTAEQVDAFLTNKTVLPALRSKKKAIVYDFISEPPKDTDKMCVVLDLASPAADHASSLIFKHLADFEATEELHFASDRIGKGVRITLSGCASDVMALVNRYYAEAAQS